jgi:hypothetical protein
MGALLYSARGPPAVAEKDLRGEEKRDASSPPLPVCETRINENFP